MLLPTIVLVEGVGLVGSGAAGVWQLRLGTAIALEVAFVAIAIRELRRSAGAELLEVRLTRAFGALLPLRIARFAAFEITIVGAALRFLFGGWRRTLPPGFTYHRESGLRLLLLFLPLIGLADVLLLELVVLPDAAPWLRVVVHALAVYGLIWLVGIYATARARPHELVDGTLALRRGILRRVDVPIADIVSIDPLPAFADDWKKRAYLRGALRLDLAGAAILELRLRAAVRPFGIFGEGAPGTRILVAVDDPATFTAAIVSPPP